MKNYILNPIKLNKIKRLEWFDLWVNKSNYITNYYQGIKGKYKIIDESINYYLVMLDISICYLKKYTKYYNYVYIQHNIILDNNMCIKEDIKERDFAEYLKYLFYKNYDIKYVYDLIKTSSNIFDYHLVIARLLYPSYYLFYFECVVINNSNQDKLYEIVKKSCDYEKYLKNVVDKMNEYLTKKIVLPF